MDAPYKQLKVFKFQANLLYAESVLEKDKIDAKTEDNALFVKPEDYDKALKTVTQLNLDESAVSDESDGYLEGYTEWADKRFVSGYFTGGNIPLWMYNKTYAKFYGPFLIASAVVYLFLPGFNSNITAFIDYDVSFGLLVWMLFFLTYLVCGILLTIRGFKKQ